VVLLVVMKWMAAITGDSVGLFLDFSPGRKVWGNHFPGRKTIVICSKNKHFRTNFRTKVSKPKSLKRSILLLLPQNLKNYFTIFFVRGNFLWAPNLSVKDH
jgi:hypothetical protein